MHMKALALVLVSLSILGPHPLVAQADTLGATADALSPYSHEQPAWKLPVQPSDSCPRFRGHPDGTGGFYYFEYELREPTLPVPGNPTPPWPGRPGRVDLQFVVDTAGVVDQRFVRVLRTDAPELATAAVQTLLASQFTPPRTVGGCKVRQQVQQAFSFRQ
jgi:hypothetical protein